MLLIVFTLSQARHIAEVDLKQGEPYCMYSTRKAPPPKKSLIATRTTLMITPASEANRWRRASFSTMWRICTSDIIVFWYFSTFSSFLRFLCKNYKIRKLSNNTTLPFIKKLVKRCNDKNVRICIKQQGLCKKHDSTINLAADPCGAIKQSQP